MNRPMMWSQRTAGSLLLALALTALGTSARAQWEVRSGVMTMTGDTVVWAVSVDSTTLTVVTLGCMVGKPAFMLGTLEGRFYSPNGSDVEIRVRAGTGRPADVLLFLADNTLNKAGARPAGFMVDLFSGRSGAPLRVEYQRAGHGSVVARFEPGPEVLKAVAADCKR